VKIGDYNYRARKLNAFEQFSIARKLAPILEFMSQQPDREKLRVNFAKFFCAVTANIPEEDTRKLINTCLDAAQRQQQANWVPVMVNGTTMFADVNEDLNVMLDIVYMVLADTGLIDFFAERPLPSQETGEKR